MDWKSFDDRSSGWGALTVGNGLPGAMLFGNDSSIAGGGTAGVGVWFCGSGGVDVLFFLPSPSPRTARAGSFLFLSMKIVLLQLLC